MELKEKLDNIIDGWKNYIFKRQDIEELAAYRESICIANRCGKFSRMGYSHCKKCGCPIATIIRSRNYKCKLNYW